MKAHALFLIASLLVTTLLVDRAALAQEPLAPLPADPTARSPTPPMTTAPPATPPPPSVYDAPMIPAEPRQGPPAEEQPEPMSEGRRIVVAWNTGFQWGLSPGVIIQHGDAAFALGIRLGYGFDTGSVIIVPGVRLAGYFSDPNVYIGMPVLKVVLPIDRFAPFVEAGIGGGYVSDSFDAAAQGGAALMVGGGFMVHFTRKFGLGAEVNYTTITGTGFHGIGVGPILALAF